jgi:hypothetical protein
MQPACPPPHPRVDRTANPVRKEEKFLIRKKKKNKYKKNNNFFFFED